MGAVQRRTAAPAVLTEQELRRPLPAFAQAEGLLDLDDTVVSHFGEFAATSPIRAAGR